MYLSLCTNIEKYDQVLLKVDVSNAYIKVLKNFDRKLKLSIKKLKEKNDIFSGSFKYRVTEPGTIYYKSLIWDWNEMGGSIVVTERQPVSHDVTVWVNPEAEKIGVCFAFEF